MIRTFLALELPEEIRRRLISLQKEILPGDYNWEKEEKLHLTLKFIGDIEEKIVYDLCKSLNFLLKSQSFFCKLDKLGIFYKFNEPSILWVGLKAEPLIKELFQKIEKALSEFGIKEEKRKFKAHITLLRFKNKKISDNDIKRIKEFNIFDEEFICSTVTLYKSKLLSSGSIYNKLVEFNLKEGL